MRGPYKLRCILPLEGTKVKADMTLYTLPSTGPSSTDAGETMGSVTVQVVDVQRKEGDLILFHKLYKKIAAKVRAFRGTRTSTCGYACLLSHAGCFCEHRYSRATRISRTRQRTPTDRR